MTTNQKHIEFRNRKIDWTVIKETAERRDVEYCLECGCLGTEGCGHESLTGGCFITESGVCECCYYCEGETMEKNPTTVELGCNICGGRMVYIRGRYPGMDNRIVCPTCMAETLDDIKGRLHDNYSRAYQVTQRVVEGCAASPILSDSQ